MRYTLFLIFVTLFSCNKHNQPSQRCEDLAAIMATDDFAKYYDLCNRSGDTVIIYTKNEVPCNSAKLPCGKTVIIKKAYFPLKINEGPANPPDEVAVDFQADGYLFFNVRHNTYYSVTVHDGKVTVTEKGVI